MLIKKTSISSQFTRVIAKPCNNPKYDKTACCVQVTFLINRKKTQAGFVLLINDLYCKPRRLAALFNDCEAFAFLFHNSSACCLARPLTNFKIISGFICFAAKIGTSVRY